MITNGQYTTNDLREIIAFWRKQNGCYIAPEEVLEIADVLEATLDAGMRVINNWAHGDLAGAVNHLQEAIGYDYDTEDENGIGPCVECGTQCAGDGSGAVLCPNPACIQNLEDVDTEVEED